METWKKLFDSIMATLAAGDARFSVAEQTLAAVAGTVLIWFAIKILLAVVEKKAGRFGLFKDNRQVFQAMRKAFQRVTLLVAGTYLIRVLNLAFIENLFHALMIMLLAGPVISFLTLLMRYLEKGVVARTENKIDDILFDLLNKFMGILIYATAGILALDTLGINVMPFVAGAGVMGIALGFAAKDTLSNLIAGVLLIIDRPFEVGDRIEVWRAPAGSASWGDVIDIGLRATKIRTTDNIIIIIPNNEIMTRDIINYTIINTKIRVRVNVGIAYDANLALAKKAVLKVADDIDWIAKEPAPKVVVRNFGESSVELQLRVWIQDARRRMDTISQVTDSIKECFDEEGIEIPYPRRDITITQNAGQS
ncbi:MAG: mechanosensitive ion channel family protein [Deltaproteobacteria bacterium]|nr:mechanosensitive ion channel family protein [Deltaproteobacteria bacterium]